MSSLSVQPFSGVPAPACTSARPPVSAQETSRSKSDVIDLSKPPTPEQVERLRSAGILGYGSVSASKSVTTASTENGARVTHFSVNYEFEYFDLVNKTAVRHSSTGIGVFTSDGSAAAFGGVTTEVTFDASRYWSGQLEDTADRLTASRQAKISYLEVNFSGRELRTRLSDLDDVYRAAKDEAVSSFTEMLGRFLDRQDRANREKDIRDSVQAVFFRYEAKYQSIAASRTPDGWMGATLYESTVSLQKLSASAQPGGKLGKWSLAELDFAAVSLSAYQSAISAAQQGGGGSEVRQALRFSMVSMKVTAMSARGLADGGLADLLRLSGRNARRDVLDAMDRYLSGQRESGGSEKDFPAAARDLFSRVFKKAADLFDRSGDAPAAIREGAMYGRRQLAGAFRQTPARRWADELEGYWSTFDDASYQGGFRAFQAEWSSFSLELSAGQKGLSILA